MFLQWNSNADGQDIFTLADDLVNTNSTSYPVAAKARAANKWLKTIWTWIFFSYGGQQYDDSNQTNMPSATDELTSGKRVYANATGADAITSVAYLDGNGEYIPLQPITLQQIVDSGHTLDSFMSTDGVPQYYMPLGESTYIFPASNVTRSAGFKQYFNRGAVSIASTATTATPGFNANFHEVMSVAIALEYAKRKTLPQFQGLLADMADYKKAITKFYSERYNGMFPPRITVEDEIRNYE